jgi:hypothetical protein
MTDAVAPDGRSNARLFPPAAHRRDSLTVAQLAELYMAAYKGRDSSRPHYLSEWVARLGEASVHELNADLIADTLDAWYAEPGRRFLGRDPKTNIPRWKPRPLESSELQPDALHVVGTADVCEAPALPAARVDQSGA